MKFKNLKSINEYFRDYGIFLQKGAGYFYFMHTYQVIALRKFTIIEIPLSQYVTAWSHYTPEMWGEFARSTTKDMEKVFNTQ